MVGVTRAQFPRSTIPTMSGVINSLTEENATGERKRRLDRISTCLSIVRFWARFFHSWKLCFSVNYAFRIVASKKIIAWIGFFFFRIIIR